MSIFDNLTFIHFISAIGAIGTVYGFYLRFRTPKDPLSKKELLKMLEEKDRQIERLIIHKNAWKMRLDHHLKKHKEQACKSEEKV